MEIRKIVIGPDYKDGMHFTLGQVIAGDNNIHHIIKDKTVRIYIKNKKEEVVLYKEFVNMPMSIEYNIDF